MSDTAQRFVIVDLRIPFVRLVLFFVKAALAAIPAAIIVGFAADAAGRRYCRRGRRQRLRHDAALVVLSGNQLRRYSVGGYGSVSSG